MPRPIRAHIDLSALVHNFNVVRGLCPRSSILAVIKANAYGHGLIRIADTLKNADGFAVIELEEAIKLRESGITKRIVLLQGFFHPGELTAIDHYQLSFAVHSDEQLQYLKQVKSATKRDILIKINTGMNRLGFMPNKLTHVLHELSNEAGINKITLMSHFACADDNFGIDEQLKTFNQLTDTLPYERTLANSAAILRFPQTHMNWVRPGVMLYGSSPFADSSAAQLGLKPVMTLSTKIIAVQNLRAGDSVGYGATYTADKAMRIGIVACGYADGYPRHAPTGTPVLVESTRSCILGRVSMDMMAVDISSVPRAGVGSDITLWGEGLPIDEVAHAAGTISYELMCAVARRVHGVE